MNEKRQFLEEVFLKISVERFLEEVFFKISVEGFWRVVFRELWDMNLYFMTESPL